MSHRHPPSAHDPAVPVGSVGRVGRAGGVGRGDVVQRGGIRRLLTAVAILAVAVAACSSAGSSTPSASTVGGSQYSVFPVAVSEDLAVGENRFLFTLVDSSNKPVAAPDRPVSVAFFPGEQPSGTATSNPATFNWGNEAAKQGYYVIDATFSQPGTWSAVFSTSAPGAAKENVPFQFDVADKHRAVQIGQPAPSTKTQTSADVGGKLAEVSTDPNPDPAFYQTSEDAALAAHKPFVVVFATPAFCRSALCGPTLDRVKALATQYPSITFIHVEPYRMQVTNGHLQPVLDQSGNLQANSVTDAWGLPTEPWVFAVDRTGIVRGSLDTVFSDAELKAALDKIR